MIVFPLIRVVELKTATALSRGSHVAYVCPQPTIPDPLDDLTQLGTIRFDDEINGPAVRRSRLVGRARDGHQRAAGANHTRRPLRDVAADHIENQIEPKRTRSLPTFRH
jgi:hypothetical protein